MKTAILILVTIILIALVTLANNTLYCFVFEHKDWKRWREICKLLPNSSLVEHYMPEDKYSFLSCYVFHIPIVDSIKCPVNVCYWENQNTVSIHHLENGGCYLCDFDTYHVKKALEIIKNKLNEYGNKIH